MINKIPDNQIAFYQTPDGSINIEVLFAEENIWLTQKKMADLFDCSIDNVSLHLKNIYQKNGVDQKINYRGILGSSLVHIQSITSKNF